MNIDKAIEILTQHILGADPLYLPDLPDAIKLSIEALIRVRNDLINPGAYRDLPLPGETPEENTQ